VGAVDRRCEFGQKLRVHDAAETDLSVTEVMMSTPILAPARVLTHTPIGSGDPDTGRLGDSLDLDVSRTRVHARWCWFDFEISCHETVSKKLDSWQLAYFVRMLKWPRATDLRWQNSVAGQGKEVRRY